MKVVQRLPTDRCCRGAAFSPNGRRLVIMAGAKMDLWEVATGRQGRSIEGLDSAGHVLQFSEAVFTSDSRYIISTNFEGLRVWDTFTGKEVRKWAQKGASNVAISPDGKWLAMTVHDGVSVWRRAN